MGLFTRDIKSLEDLFKHALKDIYYAEHQILKTLPKLIEKASDPQLKKDLKQHLKETEGQVTRLDQVFEMLGEEPKGTAEMMTMAWARGKSSVMVRSIWA